MEKEKLEKFEEALWEIPDSLEEKLERFKKALKRDIRKINTGDVIYTIKDIDHLKNWYMTDFVDIYKECWKISDSLTESLEDIVENTIWMLDIYIYK